MEERPFPTPTDIPVPDARTGDAALEHAGRTRFAPGKILAVKGLGGFHLMVDARDGAAVNRLRERKHRHEKPFALMAPNLEQIGALCEVSSEAAALLTAAEVPIVLLRRVNDSLPSALSHKPSAIAEEVAPNNPYLGVMLPYTPLHHLLLAELGFPVVATSGNLTDEPICIDETDAFQRLGRIADAFLVHDRPIARHVDDSVAWIMRGVPRLLRRARGYAPLPVLLSAETPSILAVGAHLKNTVALSVGRQAFISQHIGDLETPEAMAAFERVIADFLQMYEARPVAIAHDLHPEYLSSKWARETTNDERRTTNDETGVFVLRHSSLVGVQHHHAHLAACLAENGVDGPVLGVTWDGTGYGIDGTIWGGEFLLGDASGFTRAALLRPFRLLGGDAAVYEPRRVALAMLCELYGDAALEMDDLAPVRAFSVSERHLLNRMLARGVNAPVTTSAGRLFDGVAALIGLHQEVSFEGQAAMALEFGADLREGGAYPIVLTNDEGRRAEEQITPSVLDWQPMVEAILADLRAGVEQRIIAARFHNALVDAIIAVARSVGQPACSVDRRLLPEPPADRARSRPARARRFRSNPAPARPAQRRRHQSGADRRGGRTIGKIEQVTADRAQESRS